MANAALLAERRVTLNNSNMTWYRCDGTYAIAIGPSGLIAIEMNSSSVDGLSEKRTTVDSLNFQCWSSQVVTLTHKLSILVCI